MLVIYESEPGAAGALRIIFACVANGIGDFSVTAGKDASAGPGSRTETGGMPEERVPGRGNSHYILLLNKGWEQSGPLKFNNGDLEDLRNRFRLAARIPLPDMPEFFPAGSEGELVFQGRDILHIDAALRGQPLFSHLEALRDLVGRAADRKLAFPEFLAQLNAISLPVAWRNEIVNGLFAHAASAPASQPAKAGFSGDLDRLMDLLNRESGGGSQLSPSLNAFLTEVGRDSTGFIMRDGAARELHRDLLRTLEALRGKVLSRGEVAETLGFLASLQRLARLAKGRERQTVHLWSSLPENPESLLLGDRADSDGDSAVAIVILDAARRDAAFLRNASALARRLGCALLIQAPGEAIPEGEAVQAFAESAPKERTYFFAGGVASRVAGEECVFRPAALAFLEGLVASRGNVADFAHRALVLEDQDLFTEKGQARSTDRILDNVQWEEALRKGVNRVNGARNKSEARFPLLKSWAEA